MPRSAHNPTCFAQPVSGFGSIVEALTIPTHWDPSSGDSPANAGAAIPAFYEILFGPNLVRLVFVVELLNDVIVSCPPKPVGLLKPAPQSCCGVPLQHGKPDDDPFVSARKLCNHGYDRWALEHCQSRSPGFASTDWCPRIHGEKALYSDISQT